MDGYKLRLVKEDDCEQILSIYAPYVDNMAVSFEYEVPSIEVFRQRVRGIAAFYPYIVCERGGRVAGYAYAHRAQERAAFDWLAELSIYVHEDDHGTGAARALYHALYDLLKLQNVIKVYALVSLPNDKSVAFHKKEGFEPVFIQKSAGYKLGMWRDLMWLEKQIAPYEVPPKPIVPLSAIDSATVRSILDNQ